MHVKQLSITRKNKQSTQKKFTILQFTFYLEKTHFFKEIIALFTTKITKRISNFSHKKETKKYRIIQERKVKNVKKSRHKYLNLKLWFLFCNLRKITYASHVHRMKTCHRSTWVKDEETANARKPPYHSIAKLHIFKKKKKTLHILKWIL